MAGMIVTPNTTDLSGHTNRMVLLEVIGGSHQEGMRSSTYTMRVPCSRLSKTMQSIHRMGGKITNVTAISSASVVTPDAPKAVSPTVKETPTVAPKAVSPTVKETAETRKAPVAKETQPSDGAGFGQQKPKRKR